VVDGTREEAKFCDGERYIAAVFEERGWWYKEGVGNGKRESIARRVVGE
jgi:hypothetical protein